MWKNGKVHQFWRYDILDVHKSWLRHCALEMKAKIKKREMSGCGLTKRQGKRPVRLTASHRRALHFLNSCYRCGSSQHIGRSRHAQPNYQLITSQLQCTCSLYYLLLNGDSEKCANRRNRSVELCTIIYLHMRPATNPEKHFSGGWTPSKKKKKKLHCKSTFHLSLRYISIFS